jgi:hypothetical protein
MRKPSHSASNGQATPLEGFDVFASASQDRGLPMVGTESWNRKQDNVPRIAPQRQATLSIVLGVLVNTLRSEPAWPSNMEHCPQS